MAVRFERGKSERWNMLRTKSLKHGPDTYEAIENKTRKLVEIPVPVLFRIAGLNLRE